jgi:ABC-type Fe3+ transport system permease subunit
MIPDTFSLYAPYWYAAFGVAVLAGIFGFAFAVFLSDTLVPPGDRWMTIFALCCATLVLVSLVGMVAVAAFEGADNAYYKRAAEVEAKP